MAGGLNIVGKIFKAVGPASKQSFRVADDGDHMPGTGQRLTTGQTSDSGRYAWVSANLDSTYTLTLSASEIRGSVSAIPIKAGAWQRVPGSTAVACVAGDVIAWDAREV